MRLRRHRLLGVDGIRHGSGPSRPSRLEHPAGGRLAELAGTTERITGETVHQAAAEGDPTARKLFNEVGYWLGVGIASLVNLFDPQIVILGGGLVATGDLLLTPARESFERFVFGRAHRTLPDLALARMEANAGLIGAALLALRQHSGVDDPEQSPAGSSRFPGEARAGISGSTLMATIR